MRGLSRRPTASCFSAEEPLPQRTLEGNGRVPNFVVLASEERTLGFAVIMALVISELKFILKMAMAPGTRLGSLTNDLRMDWLCRALTPMKAE